MSKLDKAIRVVESIQLKVNELPNETPWYGEYLCNELLSKRFKLIGESGRRAYSVHGYVVKVNTWDGEGLEEKEFYDKLSEYEKGYFAKIYYVKGFMSIQEKVSEKGLTIEMYEESLTVVRNACFDHGVEYPDIHVGNFGVLHNKALCFDW